MNILKKLYNTGFFIIVNIVTQCTFCTSVFASSETQCGDGSVNLPGCKTSTITTIGIDLPNFISKLVIYVGIAAIITLMVSGLYYLTSLGNEEKTKKANKMIFYSIFGLVIAVFSYVIIQIVVNLQFS
jgi:hypothetical protein